jgi:hypothetical protein
MFPNAAVDDRFFEKHDYNALTPEQKSTLRLKRLKLGHVGNGHGGGGNGNGNGNGNGKGINNGKGPTLKSLNHSTNLLQRWLQKLTSSTCQMMMMMMNPRRKRKDLLTVPTSL